MYKGQDAGGERENLARKKYTGENSQWNLMGKGVLKNAGDGWRRWGLGGVYSYSIRIGTRGYTAIYGSIWDEIFNLTR